MKYALPFDIEIETTLDGAGRIVRSGLSKELVGNHGAMPVEAWVKLSTLEQHKVLSQGAKHPFAAHAEDRVASGIVAGMEALLLALACEGINLNSVSAAKALVTAVEAAAKQQAD
ncbi:MULTISPECIES: hypothetical protein [unclassified Variovorax]|uniref:hypothetical protein n=1 Tax=unclassified Variovorax TaxID=663243 RepID=UPI00076D078E|nr:MULTISPECIES: hypothetical protein [unclassified Variovorax]KWT98019.1 hypothetical protein APY03_0690 [Variovorax sp. WDL1]PNG50513.1 hypothetical protein CHC06_06137 [Variovorax sp. B2]PNG51386.1 hypothetical protein CHC07_06043 [Variovorax sp. B4]VTU43016.1 hypothetical protein H6P1_00336 [Variovorax sp. PBL-H6]VTU43514.1 hypothetical protein SRS16P1_00569 [Variovorax sp. SRS16]